VLFSQRFAMFAQEKSCLAAQRPEVMCATGDEHAPGSVGVSHFWMRKPWRQNAQQLTNEGLSLCFGLVHQHFIETVVDDERALTLHSVEHVLWSQRCMEGSTLPGAADQNLQVVFESVG